MVSGTQQLKRKAAPDWQFYCGENQWQNLWPEYLAESLLACHSQSQDTPHSCGVDHHHWDKPIIIISELLHIQKQEENISEN